MDKQKTKEIVQEEIAKGFMGFAIGFFIMCAVIFIVGLLIALFF